MWLLAPPTFSKLAAGGTLWTRVHSESSHEEGLQRACVLSPSWDWTVGGALFFKRVHVSFCRPIWNSKIILLLNKRAGDGSTGATVGQPAEPTDPIHQWDNSSQLVSIPNGFNEAGKQHFQSWQDTVALGSFCRFLSLYHASPSSSSSLPPDPPLPAHPPLHCSDCPPFPPPSRCPAARAALQQTKAAEQNAFEWVRPAGRIWAGCLWKGLSAVTTGMLQHVETVERIGLWCLPHSLLPLRFSLLPLMGVLWSVLQQQEGRLIDTHAGGGGAGGAGRGEHTRSSSLSAHFTAHSSNVTPFCSCCFSGEISGNCKFVGILRRIFRFYGS